MKDLFLRFCRWALPFLGIAGVVSCENTSDVAPMYGVPSTEYGVPTIDFRVSGIVTNSQTGEPVRGIKVKSTDGWNHPDDVITSETGEFVYEDRGYPYESVILEFTDIDPLEDGSYLPKTMEVELQKKQDGDGNWHFGLYVAEGVFVNLDEEDEVLPEYGCPVVEFSIKGRVLDSESNPIQNIEISHPEVGYSIRTAGDGTFAYEGCMTGYELSEVNIFVQDTDGEDNGGDFQSQEVTVSMQQTDPGEGPWNNGIYQAENVEIVLNKK